MAKGAPQDRLIGSVSRVRKEQVRVTVRQSNGVKSLDIRVYYEADDGTFKPSPRGVSLLPHEWTQLRGILQKLYQEKGGAQSADHTQGSKADQPTNSRTIRQERSNGKYGAARP